jgi:hypothetical protein
LIAHHTDDPEAHALTYSTDVMLTVEDIASVLLEAMEKRPLEMTLPRGQARMAKIGNAFPELALRSYARLKKMGLKRLEKIRLEQSRERG